MEIKTRLNCELIRYTFSVYVRIIDEIPSQFQVRNFKIDRKLDPSKLTELQYELRPVDRGEYHFGKLNIYASSVFKLIARRFTSGEDAMVPTYPSFMQLQNMIYWPSVTICINMASKNSSDWAHDGI